MITRRGLLQGLPALLAPKRRSKPVTMPGKPVFGAGALRYPQLISPNFVTKVSGWAVKQDGSAEFNNVTVRGTVTGGQFIGTGNGQEVLIYSGTPAAGNLVASVTSAVQTFTDAFGNKGIGGIVVYLTGVALSLQGPITWSTGSLSAGWTPDSNITRIGAASLRVGAALTILGALTATSGTASAASLLSTDTWQALPLGANFAAGTPAPQYALLGVGVGNNGIAMRGQVKATAAVAGFTTFASLASPYTWANDQWFSSAHNSGAGLVMIKALGGAGGILQTVNALALNDTITLDGIIIWK